MPRTACPSREIQLDPAQLLTLRIANALPLQQSKAHDLANLSPNNE